MTTEDTTEISPLIPEKKYYTPKMIQIGTFLGGPIAAGYFISNNYKAFSKAKKVRLVWLYTIIASFIIFGVVLILPADAATNRGSLKYLVPLLYSWAAFSLVKYLQEGLINEHVASGGTNYGWGRVILISIIGCAITFAALFIVLFVLLTLFPSLDI
ncbi:hypothetical protein [Mucilaginibacter myungsuensis]|uniref:Uncharacterized protein n=1 Tax=Mucilaginibacter myungsuensis TaxID=649104 RepID=A0A929KZX3_9SPHI|nr:hypothetical protein [Mucilaginibacter myungsuensis]MBE9661934.1 hypothetical protein [Mucilaginibacter myungsuensis]MDN3599633.1 hypothetical protein [Mucilaginibacter myungsuensis]